MKNEEDVKFLESMKTDRTASFGSHDKKIALQLQRKEVRVQKQKERRLKAEQAATVSNICAVQLSSSEESSGESTSDIKSPFKHHEMKLKKTHHRTTRSGTSAFIPYNILKSPKIVSLATRMKISPAQQSALTRAIIEESQGDAGKVAASYATADRARRRVNEGIASVVRKSWVPPRYASLHWDSKLMLSQTTHALQERLVVAVGDSTNVKLLGVPAYQPGTDQRSGDIIARATMQLLQSWNCEDLIVNMAFDTTASNTGHVSAACIALQQSIGRALLWSACRHHVGEVILTQVFNDLHIEASKSPEYTVFNKFKKHFDKVPHGRDETLSPFNPEPFSHDEQIINNITQWKKTALAASESSTEHQREDYKEFSELCLMYLDLDNRQFHFCRPGAVHKAQWMSKILYSIKMVLLEEQICLLPEKTIATSTQQRKLRSFVTFVCLIYSTWWMTCRSAVDAPWHDLCLYQNFLKYTQVCSKIAESAIRALNRHLWYLCSEMVPLALFSDIVPMPELQHLAKRLLTMRPTHEETLPRNRYGTGFGKPKFPTAITATTRLGDLVTGDSWYIFRLLEMNADFLNVDVENWPGHSAFLESKQKTISINVVNDSAECGVKLSADFLDAARTEEHYQNILQVVEADRKKAPSLRKTKRQKIGIQDDDNI